ncbi:hypothetical protein B0T18DRAFT_485015 [Schizothecium vesticola]|uniref:Uncharacterized protein n=1 Tax=Schizothecium vesticola TaxID=314040 RepID=A0AA40FB69_9PEZI|nr:hypothetical protein B0T18DRAFT_485015 [Schizothecium vesticola]
MTATFRGTVSRQSQCPCPAAAVLPGPGGGGSCIVGSGAQQQQARPEPDVLSMLLGPCASPTCSFRLSHQSHRFLTSRRRLGRPLGGLHRRQTTSNGPGPAETRGAHALSRKSTTPEKLDILHCAITTMGQRLSHRAKGGGPNLLENLLSRAVTAGSHDLSHSVVRGCTRCIARGSLPP